jgi:hypothetical protein
MEVSAHITSALAALGLGQLAYSFARVGQGPESMIVAVRPGRSEGRSWAGRSEGRSEGRSWAGRYALFLPLRTCRWDDKLSLACELAFDPEAETALRAEAERMRAGYGSFPVVRQIWEIRGISKRKLIGHDMFGSGSQFVNVFVYVVDQLEYPKPAWKSGKIRLLEVVLGVRL